MKRMLPPLQKFGRRVLTLIGAIGVFGVAAPLHAAPTSERAALEARVAEMRRHLNRSADAGEPGAAAAEPTLIAQAAKWNNWPNWSNWANWRNG